MEEGPLYSVVVYLPRQLGEFVDRLRRGLNPNFASWLAHATILPPRPLRAPLEESLEWIRQKCAGLESFEASLDGVSTFWPVNGVVYMAISLGAQRLVELHNALNLGLMAQQETYPYVPHVTIGQELDEAGTQAALGEASRAWSLFRESGSFQVESLSLVQRGPENRWVELAPIPLGSLSVRSRK
jgi:2'-5' RNA ligase